jgi:Zn-dependent M28 family amino/carboxypeptidase
VGGDIRFPLRARRWPLTWASRWAPIGLIALLLGSAPARSQTPGDATAHAVRPNVLRSHLEFLASDALEGRGTGARGSSLAASYVATQFERLGLEPAGENGTYFQSILLQARSYSSGLRPAAGPALEVGTDFVAYLTGSADSVEAAADVIFVGYGIAAPEERWDDYAGADVSGKVVLTLVGTPADQDSSQFRQPKRADYGFRQYKVDEALRRGAAAVFVIYRQPFPAPWSAIASAWLGHQLRLADSADVPIRVAGWLNTPAAARLLSQAGEDLDKLAVAAARPGFRARPLRLALSATVRGRTTQVHATNVLARLPGRGPRSGEAVLLGAHYDHLGIGPVVAGDSIYNGALDNASGTAGMLAIAEACVASRLQPARSLFFAAFGAEEAGLLGSGAFVRRPTVPLNRIAAMLNIDGLNLIADTRDIAALGSEWSSLGASFRAAAAAERYTITPPDSPIMREAIQQDFFNRSDQAPFARAGVPALFLYFGDQVGGAAPGSGKQKLDEYLQQRYHRPNDDLTQAFDYEAAARSLRVFARTLVSVANTPVAPSWNQGAPYKR